jgi:hypothetical protein
MGRSPVRVAVVRRGVAPGRRARRRRDRRALAAFARAKNGGLIATGSAATIVHRDRVISLAARHQLPAVYYDRYFAAAGGLISYDPNSVEE